jgi:hypothetical protein
VVERYSTLLQKLRRDTLALIKHLHINKANYPKAWALLKNRFEDARVLMGAEFDAILNFPNTKAHEYGPEKIE